MLKIRLARVGKSNTPIFRLVVAEKSRAVKRENLEILGVYNPTLSSDKFQVNKERVNYWLGKGAQPSLTVNNLLCDFAVLPKNKKVKITFGKAQKKKDIKAEKEKKPAVTETEAFTEDVKIEAKEEKPQDIQEEVIEDQSANNQLEIEKPAAEMKETPIEEKKPAKEESSKEENQPASDKVKEE